MPRFNWRTATLEEVRAFVTSARRYAATHPHAAVRMFIFQLCKGLERRLERKDAEKKS